VRSFGKIVFIRNLTSPRADASFVRQAQIAIPVVSWQRSLNIISWYTQCGTLARSIDCSARGLDGDPRLPSISTPRISLSLDFWSAILSMIFTVELLLK
jgi:hypothetical protein